MSSKFFVFLVLALLASFVGCSGKKEEATSQDATKDQDTLVAATPDVSDRDVENLGPLVDLIVAEAADLPRAEFDPAALATQLGKDPKVHFAWVREHTWWVPYRGLLRGSRGVMLDRVGSSLDRSVLLGDLLRRSGHTVRLARAQLPESLARDLLATVPPIPQRRRSKVVAPEASAKRQRAAEAIVPSLAKTLQQASDESKRRIEKGTALVRSQTQQLYSMVRDAEALESHLADQAAIAALRDHWWVELEDNGKWIALDLLEVGAKVGEPVSKATETYEWRMASDAPSIPEPDWHTVQIRVVVERYLAGDTSESTLLQSTLRPAEVLGRPIALVHHAKPWPAMSELPAKNPSARRDAALNVRVWTPALLVGNEVIAQSGFTESGDIKAHPFDPSADPGSLFGGLDSALGGGESYEPYASAEWIDYEIRSPGEPSHSLRRQVFDLLGPGRRLAKDTEFNGNAEERRVERSEVLLSRTEILLQPCEFTDEFIMHLATYGIVAEQHAIKQFADERDMEKRNKAASGILRRMQILGPVLGFASWRAALNSQHGDGFINRPNVINLRFGQRLTSAEQPAMWQMLDIASNSSDVRRGATKSAFEVRLERGVADTVAEMLTLAGDWSKAENTAALFDMVGGGKGSVVFIAPRDMAAVTRLSWPADESARIGQDINAGYMVVALRQPVELRGVQRVGWWRVDPASGETIGAMDSGFHQGQTEYQQSNTPGETAVSHPYATPYDAAYYMNQDKPMMWVVLGSGIVASVVALGLAEYCERGGTLPGC